MIWDAMTAIGTTAAAFATAGMAWITRKSVLDNQAQYRESRAQSEQHHQDSLRPVLTLVPWDGVDPVDRSGVLCKVDIPTNNSSRVFAIRCILRNIGAGPALNIKLTLRFMGVQGYGISRELAPLQAGESRGNNQEQIQLQFWPSDRFNATDIEFAPGTSWALILEYQDVFGNQFHAVHQKDPLQPWTTHGRGAAPSKTGKA